MSTSKMADEHVENLESLKDEKTTEEKGKSAGKKRKLSKEEKKNLKVCCLRDRLVNIEFIVNFFRIV